MMAGCEWLTQPAAAAVEAATAAERQLQEAARKLWEAGGQQQQQSGASAAAVTSAAGGDAGGEKPPPPASHLAMPAALQQRVTRDLKIHKHQVCVRLSVCFSGHCAVDLTLIFFKSCSVLLLLMYVVLPMLLLLLLQVPVVWEALLFLQSQLGQVYPSREVCAEAELLLEQLSHLMRRRLEAGAASGAADRAAANKKMVQVGGRGAAALEDGCSTEGCTGAGAGTCCGAGSELLPCALMCTCSMLCLTATPDCCIC